MKTVETYQLTNAHGIKLTVLNYGAIIQSLTTPQGKNLVLGYAEANDYLRTGNPFFYGAVIGRLANRVENAAFTLTTEPFQLQRNENQQHCLHSGTQGLHAVFWQVNQQTDKLILTYHSVDGEAGFPGNVDFTIEYQLTDDNSLIINYFAIPDRLTPLDLTNHTYWNLGGAQTILHDKATFFANLYLAVDDAMIPTGEQYRVKNTPLDFLTQKALGDEIALLKKTRGYDHYLVSDNATHTLKKLAVINDPLANICLSVYSTERGFQFYSGNFLPMPYAGFCIETQNFPNAINQTAFPSPLYSKEKPYRQSTHYQLSFYDNNNSCGT
jgi:aldose 1-epimerase